MYLRLGQGGLPERVRLSDWLGLAGWTLRTGDLAISLVKGNVGIRSCPR